jgi:hypothetical protein
LGSNIFRPQARRARPASLGEPDAAVNNFPPHCRSFVVLLAQCDTVSRSRRSDSSYRDSCRLVSASGLGRCAQLLSCLAFVHLGLRSGLRQPASGGFLFEHSRSLSLSRFSFSIGFSNLRATSHRRATRTLACLGQHADEVTALRHAKLRSPGEPCHRFDLNRFRFLVRLVGSIDFHRSSLVRLGFVFVSRSVPADNVASLLLCLGPCLIRSREECSSTAGCTCGRAHLGFLARKSAV